MSATTKRLGRTILLELHGCDREALNDLARLRAMMIEAVRRSGATYVTDVFHEFNPHGLSGVVVIAESHVAVHTWPEYGLASVDIFSCSEKMDAGAIRAVLADGLRARDSSVHEVDRGVAVAR